MVSVYHGSSQVWRRVEGRVPLRCDFDQQAVDYACRDGEMVFFEKYQKRLFVQKKETANMDMG